MKPMAIVLLGMVTGCAVMTNQRPSTYGDSDFQKKVETRKAENKKKTEIQEQKRVDADSARAESARLMQEDIRKKIKIQEQKNAEELAAIEKSGRVRDQELESNHVAFVNEVVGKHPELKKYRKAALNREVMVGMPEVLFESIRTFWSCEQNVTEAKNRHHTQHVCYGASSKDGTVQGKYFYVEGPMGVSNGEKVYGGTVTAIQN